VLKKDNNKSGGEMRIKVFGSVFIAVLFLSGCDLLNLLPKTTAPQASKPTGAILAEVNGDYITLEDFDKELAAVNATLASQDPTLKIETIEQKRAYLKDMVDRKLLYQEALDRGLDRDPEFKRQLDNFKSSYLVTKMLSEEMVNVEVTSGELDAAYQEIKARLREPDQRKLREIIVSTKNEANEILSQLLMGADFATTATLRSKAKSASKGGDLGYITMGSKGNDSDVFDSIAFSSTLDVGSLSQVFKCSDGYYILKLEAKKDGRQIPLSEVQDRLKANLEQQKQQGKIKAIIDKIYQQKQAKIRMYESNIK